MQWIRMASVVNTHVKVLDGKEDVVYVKELCKGQRFKEDIIAESNDEGVGLYDSQIGE